jgi:hypothetical protein
MFSKTARRVGLVAATATLVASLTTVSALADDGRGSISGHFTTSDGAPIANATVAILDPTGGTFGTAQTDAAGAYLFPSLFPGGEFLVQFTSPEGLAEFAPEAEHEAAAGRYRLETDEALIVDEQALPHGTFTGTLRDAHGDPEPYVFVNAAADNGDFNGVATDAAGHWVLPVFVGTYYIYFGLIAENLTQYVPGQLEPADATRYDVADGQTITIDDPIRPLGTMSGHYRDENGNPDVGAQVYASLPDGTPIAQGGTDGNGDYSMSVFAGTYLVSFYGSDNRTQYAYGATDQAGATPITVPADGSVVVDDAHVAGGNVTVTAKDASTGKTIKNFCAYADSDSACTTTGTAVLSHVRAGHQEVTIAPDGAKYLPTGSTRTVDVVAGGNVAVTFSLKPGAVVKTKIVDAVTGAPIEGACVRPMVPGRVTWAGAHYCSDATGAVTMSPLTTGSYAMFVDPPAESVYGAQWVGKTGGQGVETNARLVTATEGKTVSTATIKLDHAGTVTGTVTGDGKPVTGALMGPNSIIPGLGDPLDDTGTDAHGNYTLTNLGPYAWPLYTFADGWAPQWTGGVGNRLVASTVKVIAEATVTANVALKHGTTLTGTAVKGDGTPIGASGLIVLYNSKTDDVMGLAASNPDGTFSVPVIPGQTVRIAYEFQDEAVSPAVNYFGWYGGTDWASAQIVKITSPGQTLQVVMQPGDRL